MTDSGIETHLSIWVSLAILAGCYAAIVLVSWAWLEWQARRRNRRGGI